MDNIFYYHKLAYVWIIPGSNFRMVKDFNKGREKNSKVVRGHGIRTIQLSTSKGVMDMVNSLP